MAAPENSYEWNAERLTLAKLRTDSRLDTFEIRPHEEVSPSTIDTIIIRAVKGEVNLEGPGGYMVNVYVTFQTALLTPAAADTLALAISEAMYRNDPDFTPELPDILFASLEKETETVRADTKKLRKRTVSFPYIMALFT